jgi:alanine dehydrogenase
MKIGVPKEIKNHEYRVGLTPESVAEVVRQGHQVFVETLAGDGIGAGDDCYLAAGATILGSAAEVFAAADLVVKVKEPLAAERAMLSNRHALFTYLHLAPDPEQTRDLMASGATCIAYETITDKKGGLALLKPMSQVAGRMAVHAGASALEKSHGGRGVLLGGVPGVASARVLIIGGGIVGYNAAQMAVGLRADVTVLDTNAGVLEKFDRDFAAAIKTRFSTRQAIESEVLMADLVIGAVLIPGAAAPKLVSREQVSAMKKGAVLVDVAIDQGGCFATSRPTTHANPTYVVDEVVHYCVANMPGAVARTSSYALNNATLPYLLKIAGKGWQQACREDRGILAGVNICHGKVSNQAVAEALGYAFSPPEL